MPQFMENLVYNTWRGQVVVQVCCWIQDGSYPPLISFDLIHHAVTVVSANWFNPAPLTLRWTRHLIRDCKPPKLWKFYILAAPEIQGLPSDSQWKAVWESWAAEFSVEVWENCCLDEFSGPPLGVLHGRPWASKPDGWFLYTFPLAW